MAMKDIFNTTDVRLAFSDNIAAADSTTALAGNVIDIAGFNAVLFSVTAEYSADSTVTLKLSVLHSDDNSTFTAAEDDHIIYGADISKTANVGKIGYIGSRRYVKLVVKASEAFASTVTADTKGHAILQRPAVAPV